MNIPKNAGKGNTFVCMNIGAISNFCPNAEVVNETYFINGRKVTKEEFENFDADKEEKV